MFFSSNPNSFTGDSGVFLILDSMDMDSSRPRRVSLGGGLLMLAEAAVAVERQCKTNIRMETEEVDIPTCDSVKVAHLSDVAAAVERQFRTETHTESEKVDGSNRASPKIIHLSSPMDVSSLLLPSNVVGAAESALRSLSILDHSEDNGFSSIQAITDYVYAVNLASNDSEDDAKYLSNFGKVLVIEEFDVLRLLGDGHTSFRAGAGEMAGLNSTLFPYRRRLHVFCDQLECVYFANNLGDSYHYHVRQVNLNHFLMDVHRQRTTIRVMGLNGCGRKGSNGVWTESYNSSEQSDCVIYTAATPLARSLTVTKDNEGNEWDDVSFGCVSGRATRLFESYVSHLYSEHIFQYLIQEGNGDDHGANVRNHDSSIAYGFCTMNCTNSKKDGFLWYCNGQHYQSLFPRAYYCCRTRFYGRHSQSCHEGDYKSL